MMARKSRLAQLVFGAIVAVCMIVGSSVATAAEKAQVNRPPAGQMCPGGSYVVGFDDESNIICSGEDKHGDVNPAETAGDVKPDSGGSGSEQRQAEQVNKVSADKVVAAETLTAEPAGSAATSGPVITEVNPKTALYGAKETKITISGAGFGAESVIIFAGKKYSPSVNQAGTRLDVTIPTRDLSMGRYAITVSNGPGLETTRKKALEIF